MFIDAKLWKRKSVADNRNVWLEFAGAASVFVEQDVPVPSVPFPHRLEELARNEFGFAVVEVTDADDTLSTNTWHAFSDSAHSALGSLSGFDSGQRFSEFT